MLLHHPWLIVAACRPLAGGWATSPISMSARLHAAMDEGGFILDYVAPPGTSLTETDRLLRQVEAIVRDDARKWRPIRAAPACSWAAA